jgi:hypothetical protein
MNQKEAVMNYIDRFGSITPMQAFTDLGITKLSTRISELQRDGIKFKKELIPITTRLGHKTQYMRYSRGE